MVTVIRRIAPPPRLSFCPQEKDPFSQVPATQSKLQHSLPEVPIACGRGDPSVYMPSSGLFNTSRLVGVHYIAHSGGLV